jgi:hypothetical protein
MGKMIEVEIIDCEKFSMKGKVIDQVDFKYPLRTVQFKKGEVTGISNLTTKDPNNNNDKSTCCGSCNCGDDSHPETETESTNNNSEACCTTNKTIVANKSNLLHSVDHSNSKLKKYAYAGLVAASAILFSRILLRVFY